MKRDEAEYQRIHRDVRRLYGAKASMHQCLWCFDPAQQYAWMWRTGRPQSDLSAYVPLCRRDHEDYDRERVRAIMAEKSRGNSCAKGHTLTAEALARCSRKGSRHSEETKAKMRAAQQARRARERLAP